jgi:aminoglycoside phosphotransferase (APT) family kinase protein
MSHAWEQTITIDTELALKLITEQQHIAVKDIQLLDAGWDNVVYRVNQTLIFRFPRREFGIVCMENEIALTPYIQSQVPFILSAAQWIGKPTQAYPYVYAGYSQVLGKPLCEAAHALVDNVKFARTLAAWLKALHAIPVTEDLQAQVKGSYEWKLNIAHRVSRCYENLTHYEKYYEQAGFNKAVLVNIIELFKQWSFEPIPFVFVHGDLYSRHIIVNEMIQPVGLIDWGDVHIGHPGVDLSSGMIFTKKALTVFLDTYGSVNRNTQQVMLFNSFCHSMSFLPYAFEQKKEDLQHWATLVLQRVIDEVIELEK